MGQRPSRAEGEEERDKWLAMVREQAPGGSREKTAGAE